MIRSRVVDVGAVVDDNFQQNFVGRVKTCPTSIEVKFEFSRDHRAMLLYRLLTKEASALTATAAHVSIVQIAESGRFVDQMSPGLSGVAG